MLLGSSFFFLLLVFKEQWTRKRYIENSSLRHIQITSCTLENLEKILKQYGKAVSLLSLLDVKSEKKSFSPIRLSYSHKRKEEGNYNAVEYETSYSTDQA